MYAFHCSSIEKTFSIAVFSTISKTPCKKFFYKARRVSIPTNNQIQMTVQHLISSFFQFRHRLIYGFLPLLRRVSLLIPKKRVNAYSFYCGSIAYQLKKCPQDTFSIAVTLHKKNAPIGASLFGRRREIAR